MNIPDNFDLYFEKKLSDKARKRFEKDLREKPEFLELYNEYLKINHIVGSDLDSPLLNNDNDPLLADLSISQRLTIEEDVLRFQKNPSNISDETSSLSSGITLEAKKQPSIQKKEEEEKKESEFMDIIKGAADGKTDKGNNKFFTYLGIAAAILLAFFAGEFLLRENISIAKNLSPQQAYTRFYNPQSDDELKNIISKDKTIASNFNNYKRSEGPEPFSLEDSVSPEDPFSPDDPALAIIPTDYDLSIGLLFQGIIEMERSNSSEALNCFSKILALEKPGKPNSAKFYMSLVYLSENDSTEALPILKELSLTKNPYRKSARKILRSL